MSFTGPNICFYFNYTCLWDTGNREFDFTSTYMYITTGTGQNAGIFTVKPNNANDTVHDTVYFNLSLPDGVKSWRG